MEDGGGWREKVGRFIHGGGWEEGEKLKKERKKKLKGVRVPSRVRVF